MIAASLIGAVIALVVLLLARQSLAGVGEAFGAPKWMLLGGLMSALIILAITIAGPRIGIVATTAVLIASQFTLAAIIDRFGWFGVERLAIGDRVMIFDLVEFETDRHLTLRLREGTLFPDLALTYAIMPAAGAVRLILKFVLRYESGVVGTLNRWLLPWGDLIMARRQLLNLRDLAEGAG